MDYRFLVEKELEKFFADTELSVGEILRTILSHKLTGINITNKSKFIEITDKEWYSIIEKSFEDLSEDVPMNEDEWKEFLNKVK